MKNKHAILPFCILGAVITIILTSCKSGLDENQKLFLDYAKLENRYGNNGFYNNFDLYNLNAKPAIYKDSAFNFSTFKNHLTKNFKLVINGNRMSPDLGNFNLQYPHQYVIKPHEDGSANIKFSVFVPDAFYKFSVDKNDIGKTIVKDGAEVTLLDMTNDGVTLMVVNRAKRQSYDYTYDGFEQKDFSEKKKYEQPKQPGYDGELFVGESIEDPNRNYINEKDSLMRTDFSRLNISLIDEQGKTLVSEGRINDFRHYLWYRNKDMPYPQLTSAYYDLKSKYKELDQDSLHNFNPIYIVNLKASGKVGRVDFFLRSNKGHVEAVDLGKVVPQQQFAQNEQIIDKQDEILPIANISKEEVSKSLKINCITVPVKLNEADYLLVYASVPHGYNNKRMSLTFDDLKLISGKDTIGVENTEDADDYFSVGNAYRNANLRAIRFAPKMQNAQKIIGKINLSVGNYYDKTFDVKNLPKGMTLAPDGMTLLMERGEAVENVVELYAFNNAVGTQPLATVRQKNYDYSSPISKTQYVEKVNKIVLRYRKSDAELNQEIPFELVVPQKNTKSK